MTEKDVVETETEQFLRRKQRHACLFRRAVTLSLIAFYARSDQVVRRAFAALRTWENVVKRQLFRMLGFTAILTAIAVTDVDAGTLHRCFAIVAANVNVVTQTNHRRHRKRRRGRMQHIIAVILLNKDRTAKP